MRVLVIGGSGFIGNRLLGLLRSAGHDVVNLDMRSSPAHRAMTRIGDVRVLDDVVEAASGCDVIVNLAAEHRDDVTPLRRYEETNVGGARNVVSAAERCGISRIVFTSSVAVYGLDKREPVETSPTEPFNEYSRTKVAAEKVLEAWADADPRRSLLVVRPCVVFGEGNRGNVYTLVRQIASRRFVMVGDGRNRKSMCYVGNVAAYLAERLTGRAGRQVVNYADKPDLTVRELVDLVATTLGRRQPRFSLPRWLGLLIGSVFDVLAAVTRRTFPVSAVRVRKFCAETSIGTRRLEDEGFVPPHGLAEALQRTIELEFGPGSRPDERSHEAV